MARKKAGSSPGTGPEEYLGRVKTPKKEDGEQLAIIMQLMGGDQVKALCEDGIERQLRIPGKLRKRVWLRENDVIITKLWDFQPSKGDVVWRYLGNQVMWLKKKGLMKAFPI